MDHRNVLSAGPAFEELLRDARAGCPNSLGRLLERYRRPLEGTAARWLPERLRAKADGADLVQETFLRANRYIGAFRGTREAELVRWLRQLLRSRVVSFQRLYRDGGRREAAREVSLGGERVSDAAEHVQRRRTPTPAVIALDREWVAGCRKLFAQLTARHQQVLTLRYGDGLPFEDVGRALALTADAARKLCDRALKCLGELMPGEDDEPVSRAG
jgi:RNA polymerase sigma-70 factor (subfamily 1)